MRNSDKFLEELEERLQQNLYKIGTGGLWPPVGPQRGHWKTLQVLGKPQARLTFRVFR